MRVFITGGVGFIGINLADHHLRAGHEVTIFDDLSRDGTASNMRWLRERHGDGPTVIQGDIRDFEALTAALPPGVDSVRGLAALITQSAGLPTSIRSARPSSTWPSFSMSLEPRK